MKRFGLVGLIVLLSLSAAQIGLAQSELVLSINRDFGYGGFEAKSKGCLACTLTALRIWLMWNSLSTKHRSPYPRRAIPNSVFHK